MVCLAAAAASSAFSCSASSPGDSQVSATGGTGATAGSGGGNATAGAAASAGTKMGPPDIMVPPDVPVGCTGLACKVPACAAPGTTTITGKVYDPAGKVPLYNVAVYVPNAPVAPLMDGASCDRCAASILNPVTSAITDESGAFKLEKAPAGENIPLVFQVGKWRRQITIPSVAACAETALTDPQVTRLPRNRTEGDIPRIAISVGAADQMECLPLRMGLDAAEFTTAGGDGRVHLYLGHSGPTDKPLTKFDAAHNGGAPLASSDMLWADKASLMKYDITILSCEGSAFADQKPMAVRQAMYDYASSGGRVFASHWHNVWFGQGPAPVPTTGTWSDRKDPVTGNQKIPGTINQTFPKGQALAQWLVNVGASTMLGTMDLVFPRDNLQAVDPLLAREWITLDNPNFPSAPKSVQYMSFNAPIGAAEDKICGRAVYTDLHVAAVDRNPVANAKGFPASCEVRDLTAQEKAVAFMLFDLSACVQSEDKKPQPPR